MTPSVWPSLTSPAADDAMVLEEVGRLRDSSRRIPTRHIAERATDCQCEQRSAGAQPPGLRSQARSDHGYGNGDVGHDEVGGIDRRTGFGRCALGDGRQPAAEADALTDARHQ